MDIMIRGHRCVYDRTGQGPDLALLHSVGLSTGEGWRNQIPALSRRFRVLSFDFRGLGQSERGTEPLGVTTFVRDLEDLLEKLGITRTALMGVSLGGFVAQAFALKRPEMVYALVLVSTAGRIYSGHAGRRAERNDKIRRHGMAIAADHQVNSHFSEDFARDNPDVLTWYKAHYLQNDPENYIAIMDDLGHFDSSDRLASLGCPTLIVAGDMDNTSVAGKAPLDSARTLHRLIPGSELTIIKGAQHYPHIDHVDAFNACVIDFLTAAISRQAFQPANQL